MFYRYVVPLPGRTKRGEKIILYRLGNVGEHHFNGTILTGGGK